MSFVFALLMFFIMILTRVRVGGGDGGGRTSNPAAAVHLGTEATDDPSFDSTTTYCPSLLAVPEMNRFRVPNPEFFSRKSRTLTYADDPSVHVRAFVHTDEDARIWQEVEDGTRSRRAPLYRIIRSFLEHSPSSTAYIDIGSGRGDALIWAAQFVRRSHGFETDPTALSVSIANMYANPGIANFMQVSYFCIGPEKVAIFLRMRDDGAVVRVPQNSYGNTYGGRYAEPTRGPSTNSPFRESEGQPAWYAGCDTMRNVLSDENVKVNDEDVGLIRINVKGDEPNVLWGLFDWLSAIRLGSKRRLPPILVSLYPQLWPAGTGAGHYDHHQMWGTVALYKGLWINGRGANKIASFQASGAWSSVCREECDLLLVDDEDFVPPR